MLKTIYISAMRKLLFYVNRWKKHTYSFTNAKEDSLTMVVFVVLLFVLVFPFFFSTELNQK